MALFMFITLLVLMLLSVPIAFSLGLSSIVAILIDGNLPYELLIQRMFTSIDSFALLAVPFFVLAGKIMGTGGISRRLVNLASAFIGHMSGGLAVVTIVASMLFGAISGSSAATVAALGAILIPAMIKKGYSKRFAAASQAVSGELGVIIPPSIPMILYGVSTGTSIGAMFLAGIVPGLIIGLLLVITVTILAKMKGYPNDVKTTWKDKWIALKESTLALLMPVIILGGIYGGIFTPTEAAAVSVAYALIVGLWIYKEIKIKDLLPILGESAVLSAIIMIIVSAAGLFGWIMTKGMIPQQAASLITDFTTSKVIFLLLVNLFLFFIGMFFETSAAIIILAPILLPVALTFDVDPVHFGIIMIVNLAMGMVTPPVGVNLFISSRIAGITLEEITKGILPFLLVLIINLLILTFLPVISLWLPNLL
ncbi:TRAP transporter large permease [Alkalihalobacillus oceani]|uniref:TRAP transporter large permease n=1 Tax=Halalkalibacter oceani TaxID=1653776 RepID=A0A9X2IPX7_9BACI|nr:TRAP transporter large permease [Halalkalibacter oceani]MCM3714892.1 TRAP transporter large permease [Halalkalibacter oceani]